MGQKVRPIGFRTGIMLGWKSNWCASKRDFPELLVEDQKIRKHINTKFKNAELARSSSTAPVKKLWFAFLRVRLA